MPEDEGLVGFSPELIGMSEEEESKLESIRRDLDHELAMIFEHDFKSLTRTNAEQFISSVNTFLKVIGNHIQEYEYEVNKFFSLRDKYLEIWKEQGGSESDVAYKAMNAVVEVVKRIAVANTYRAYMIEVLRKERSRVMSLIREVRDIEVEKIKIDTTSAMYEKILAKYDEMTKAVDVRFDKLEKKYESLLSLEREQKERERDFARSLMSRLKQIHRKVVEVDSEADEFRESFHRPIKEEIIQAPSTKSEDFLFESDYICEQCDRVFADEQTLGTHMKERHKEELE